MPYNVQRLTNRVLAIAQNRALPERSVRQRTTRILGSMTGVSIDQDKRPMDDMLRARLHLAVGSKVRLKFIRAALHAVDTTSRAVSGQPFFGLSESEALLEQLAGLNGAELVQEILGLNGGTRIVANGLEHVPSTGPIIIASTHPTGMFDFIAHASALLQRRPDLKVVANQEVERFLGPDCIVSVRLDKENRPTSTRAVYHAMHQHLKSSGALLIFGSGRVPHRINGQLVEPEWRSGASRTSQFCQVPVIPAALNARNSNYYYRIRAFAQFVSGGNDNFAAMVGSLRYAAELLAKLGGNFDTYYGAPLGPGTAPHILKAAAESLTPGLYAEQCARSSL